MQIFSLSEKHTFSNCEQGVQRATKAENKGAIRTACDTKIRIFFPREIGFEKKHFYSNWCATARVTRWWVFVNSGQIDLSFPVRTFKLESNGRATMVRIPLSSFHLASTSDLAGGFKLCDSYSRTLDYFGCFKSKFATFLNVPLIKLWLFPLSPLFFLFGVKQFSRAAIGR